ncbi:hypothetical protein ERICIV_04616 (plasmid) [Paenibacillus larvae subsp. larvae]|uniref:Uncharacterized protein n=1 Tax=Paenibacillus larvae subsp. larvae TaxID=147375 RepID=A0A2L1U811_9BACL|nr:hypothetical protein [Paenibacillus larvae]AQT87036.1 hypothetical protein B1222_23690 [Paenibacillus larvae subsp. pulvifaciens]AQZ49354.1 hypothetical protein B5S25_22895 [Paenibacillus larvae subsp. pulvifaciens]AVF28998.1 hypothetical protein ERICIII_04997 [Paenibacillus larvae subsp. larvae]AVF33379.1 hypothetical protein ERICIV_04616 [Paenibacillus larvae subsp. larvae]MBH0341151.1 hypothetical protein [Paenibacillus larvae]
MIIDGIEYEDVLEITERRVLRSAAGFYIGRLVKMSWSDGNFLPFDRQSGYFRKEIDAQAALERDS